MTNLISEYPQHLNDGERQVIDRLIRDALDAGCTISVHDGEEHAIKNSTDYTAITRAVAATDQTIIIPSEAANVAIFDFIHGNAPWEVLTDLTDSPWANELVMGAEAVAEKLEEQGL